MALDGQNVGRRVSATTVLFGVVLVLVGAFLMLQTNHLLPPDFLRKFWPLGIVAAGVIVVLRGVLNRNAEADGRLPWGLLIFVLIVGSVAVQATSRSVNLRGTDSADDLTVSSVMGPSQVVSQSTSFKHAAITSVMGGASVDLRNATIAPGTEATVDVDVLMGGVVLRVPETWIVEVGTTTIFGGTKDERSKTSSRSTPGASGATADAAAGAAAPSKLKIRGTVLMGGLVIRK